MRDITLAGGQRSHLHSKPLIRSVPNVRGKEGSPRQKLQTTSSRLASTIFGTRTTGRHYVVSVTLSRGIGISENILWGGGCKSLGLSACRPHPKGLLRNGKIQNFYTSIETQIITWVVVGKE